MDSSGMLVANGLNKFHNFDLFVLEEPPKYVLQNRYSTTGAKNLKKPAQEFIFSKNLGLTMNSFTYISFLRNPFVDGCLHLIIDTPQQYT